MDDVAWTAEFLRSIAPRGVPVTFAHALVSDEAHWFREAIERRVITIGTCRADCPRSRRWSEATRDEFLTPADQHRHLFSLSAAGGASMNREYVPHIAAVARAIIHFGFSADRFSLSLYRTFQRDCVTKKRGQSYETDAEFYAADGSVELHVEAKKTHGEVSRIAKTLAGCRTLSNLPLSCQKELEYVLDLKPKHVWLVAPGCIDPEQYVYAVRVDDTQAEFQPVPRLTAIHGG